MGGILVTMTLHRRDVAELDVLRAAREYHAGHGPMLDEALPQYPVKLVMARVAQLTDQGLMDCGVSERTSFLTEAGRRRLCELEAS